MAEGVGLAPLRLGSAALWLAALVALVSLWMLGLGGRHSSSGVRDGVRGGPAEATGTLHEGGALLGAPALRVGGRPDCGGEAGVEHRLQAHGGLGSPFSNCSRLVAATVVCSAQLKEGQVLRHRSLGLAVASLVPICWLAGFGARVSLRLVHRRQLLPVC